MQISITTYNFISVPRVQLTNLQCFSSFEQVLSCSAIVPHDCQQLNGPVNITWTIRKISSCDLQRSSPETVYSNPMEHFEEVRQNFFELEDFEVYEIAAYLKNSIGSSVSVFENFTTKSADSN